MKLNDFLQNVIAQFDELEEVNWEPTIKYKELPGWTSLTALCIIAMINEEYDVVIEGEDIQKASTIKELFDIVVSRS